MGVYVCHCGGNISDVVDVEEVVNSAALLPHVVLARTNMFMCSDAGQAMIMDDIQKEGLNRIVVASCSPKLHELTFRGVLRRAGLNEYLYEHVNIREQVSWVHHAHHREATEKALRLVGAATAKASRLTPLTSIRVDAHSHALVVGGGVSGLKSALDLARRGITVTLVEREPFLGGQVSVLHRIYPTEESAADIVVSLVEAVLREPKIQVLTRAEVVEASGSIGNFKVMIRREGAVAGRDGKVARTSYEAFRGCYLDGHAQPPSTMELTVGSIIMATGFQHYEPSSGEYGYGENPRVITLPEFIRILSSEAPTAGYLLRDGRPVKAVAFIHCVGSRQIPGIHEPAEDGRLNEYCSRVCCTATLQAAVE
ncbi:MAG: CoB--CoM heterodisulfide reductase iron-sulfur subunit A family protein, partial [Thermodesulfobacteriota bacterium]